MAEDLAVRLVAAAAEQAGAAAARDPADRASFRAGATDAQAGDFSAARALADRFATTTTIATITTAATAAAAAVPCACAIITFVDIDLDVAPGAAHAATTTAVSRDARSGPTCASAGARSRPSPGNGAAQHSPLDRAPEPTQSRRRRTRRSGAQLPRHRPQCRQRGDPLKKRGQLVLNLGKTGSDSLSGPRRTVRVVA